MIVPPGILLTVVPTTLFPLLVTTPSLLNVTLYVPFALHETFSIDKVGLTHTTHDGGVTTIVLGVQPFSVTVKVTELVRFEKLPVLDVTIAPETVA